MDTLCIKNLCKSYGDVQVLKGINISVSKGEFISLLGPSGCGKTTLLRIIAGLTEASEGSIEVEGKDVSGLPPFKRNNGMVFQNYALFPHMTVQENIAFGLKMHGVGKKEIGERVEKGLAMIHLEHLGKRYPKELSGGQQQRVALVRALVLNPTLLLLDEPLSNLDAKLRKEMRIEIRRIQKELNVTAIFVTHDQEEALTMSDRIAVMNAGRLEQIGTPVELYERPKTRFVADFIGSTNLLTCSLADSRDGFRNLGYHGHVLSAPETECGASVRDVVLSVRPERIWISASPVPEMNQIPCTIVTKVYLGASARLILQDRDGQNLIADISSFSPAAAFGEGDAVVASWKKEDGLIIAE